MSNFTKINLLSERTSRVPPVVFLKGKTTHVYCSPDQVQTEEKTNRGCRVRTMLCYPSLPCRTLLLYSLHRCLLWKELLCLTASYELITFQAKLSPINSH